MGSPQRRLRGWRAPPFPWSSSSRSPRQSPECPLQVLLLHFRATSPPITIRLSPGELCCRPAGRHPSSICHPGPVLRLRLSQLFSLCILSLCWVSRCSREPGLQAPIMGPDPHGQERDVVHLAMSTRLTTGWVTATRRWTQAQRTPDGCGSGLQSQVCRIEKPSC